MSLHILVLHGFAGSLARHTFSALHSSRTPLMTSHAESRSRPAILVTPWRVRDPSALTKREEKGLAVLTLIVAGRSEISELTC